MEFHKKIFLHSNVVLLLIAFCLAQTESTPKPATHSSAELNLEDSTNGYLSEENETEIRTTTSPPSHFYTPLPIFPSDETVYTTNETLIRQLLKLNENDSEVDDLTRKNDRPLVQDTESQENNLQNTTANNNKSDINEDGINVEERPGEEVQNIDGSDENDYGTDLDEDTDDAEIPKSETEWIEDGENTEDDKMNVSVEVINETINSSTVHYSIKSDYFGIFAGFFIIIGVILYLIVTAWRRMLQHRYRSREMLINEDEFYDRNDMKHFSI